MPARTLEQLVEWFDTFEDTTYDARKSAERDRAYYDGAQWTTAEAEELKRRGQPVITMNRIAPKVDFVMGMEIQSRTDPRAFPRNPGMDQKSADVATDVLRYIVEDNDFDPEVSRAGANLFIEGTCAGHVFVETGDNGEPEVRMDHVPWDRVFFDPHSRREDFRDAKYYGFVLWMDLDDAIAMYPDAKDALNASQNNYESTDDTFADRPRNGVWSDHDGRRPRVKVCEIWYRDEMGPDSPAGWYTATYTKAGFLSPPQLSPYVNEAGIPVPSLVLQSVKIDRENNRYGMVRHLISPQDEINKRRSKALHLLNVRQTLSERGAVEDLRQAKQELAKPDGHVVINPNTRFEVLPTGEMAAGQFQLLREAKQEMDAIGANAALSGKETRTQSGKAIQARQQGGFVELTPFIDGLRQWKLRMYRQAWLRVKQFWTYERYVRTLDDQMQPKFVGINRPVTVAEELQARGIPLDDDSVVVEFGAQFEQVSRVENDVGMLDVDIVLAEGPDLVTLVAEQFEQLANLAHQGIPIPPEMLIEASSLRNKDKIMSLLKNQGMNEEQQAAAAAEAAKQREIDMERTMLELEEKEAEIQKLRSEVAKNISQAGKNQADIAESEADAQEQALENAQVAASLGTLR